MIYHVDATYNNTVSGDFDSGLVIADSTELFRYGGFGDLTPYAALTQVRQGEVQFVSWAEALGKVGSDTVTTAFIRPFSSERLRIGGAEIEHVRYESSTGTSPTCGLREYRFTRFEEGADSLVVSVLARVHGPREDVLRFRKGDVKATLDENGFVERLVVKKFVAGVYPGYRTAQPYELAERPTVCTATYWLNHAGSEKQRISDYGVFKPFWSCPNKEAC